MTWFVTSSRSNWGAGDGVAAALGGGMAFFGELEVTARGLRTRSGDACLNDSNLERRFSPNGPKE